MSIRDISNMKSINNYRINLDKEEREAQACLRNECGHGEEDRCVRHIAECGWHESMEENRLLTVEEYMTMAPSVAEEFVKRWIKQGGDGADSLRAHVVALKLMDPLGILTMFAFLVGNPADDGLREEFYKFLEDDEAGPEVTEANFFEELEKSMQVFANLKQAEVAWETRVTAHAGPKCDQCGEARVGFGGRVCEPCDLEEQERKGDWGDLGPRISRDIPRRTHDDAFADDYDGDDEEWETPSQEAERRQEMAENMERQMEEHEQQCEANDTLPTSSDHCGYCLKTLNQCWCDESDWQPSSEAAADLSRAIFEMNSAATADPNVRIGYNVSHIVPENLHEIMNRC